MIHRKPEKKEREAAKKNHRVQSKEMPEIRKRKRTGESEKIGEWQLGTIGRVKKSGDVCAAGLMGRAHFVLTRCTYYYSCRRRKSAQHAALLLAGWHRLMFYQGGSSPLSQCFPEASDQLFVEVDSAHWVGLGV